MRRPVILLARVLAYINIADVFPGTVFFPEFFEALVSKYRFQQYPQERKDFDIKNGIELTDGIAGEIAIARFVIWENILVLETRVSTEASTLVLEGMLLWATEKFGLKYHHGDIKRFAFISDIAFQSHANFLTYDPILRWLAEETSVALTQIWDEPVEYRTTSIKVGHDPILRHLGIAPFSLERRGQARFSDNEYFSEAPLPTSTHLRLLEEFETRVTHDTNLEANG